MNRSEKINGYTREEAKELVDYVAEGKREGKALSYLFETFGRSHGRAKGSVRNYYYTLLKQQQDDRVVQLLDGTNLTVERIRAFTEEETDWALRSILAEKAKGMSVRKAIKNISDGDEKLMLRLQNKYRNLLKKQPDRVRRAAQEMGVQTLVRNESRERSALQRRLEEEINALCDRLTAPLREENARLREEIEKLRANGKNYEDKI